MENGSLDVLYRYSRGLSDRPQYVSLKRCTTDFKGTVRSRRFGDRTYSIKLYTSLSAVQTGACAVGSCNGISRNVDGPFSVLGTSGERFDPYITLSPF